MFSHVAYPIVLDVICPVDKYSCALNDQIYLASPQRGFVESQLNIDTTKMWLISTTDALINSSLNISDMLAAICV